MPHANSSRHPAQVPDQNAAFPQHLHQCSVCPGPVSLEDLPEKEERYELHRLLGALLSAKLNVDEKFDIIGNEFDIPLESDIRKDVNDMCNLSQGIKEQAYVEGTENGIAIGKQEGITIGKREGIAETIVKMYRKGYEAEQISDILDMEVEEVREIIENE